MVPFVSVIIPVYNAEKYLRECLDSVVNQTLRDIEIICVDDGSTDSSPAVLAEYAARDPRVRVITQENRSAGAARNAGIRAARGEFVAFLDPDDLLPDESVYEALYFYAKENRVRVCGGGVCSLANDGKRYFPDASWGANVDQAFPREGFMRFADWQFDYGFYRYIFERRLLLDDEIFFPPYIRYQDPPFCARALEAAGEFYALRRTTYVFRDWHTPDYTDRRRVCDQLRGIRDLLKFSRERGYAKLHWLQIHRLFEEFKPHVLALAEREKNGEDVPADQSAIALLKEIDELADVRLARRHSADTPYYSVDAEFLHPEIKVSVIIPVYNVEKYLRQCLDSVVNQTLRDIEIICINDGSPDNSLSILQEYAKRDFRFVIVDQENQGVGRSRNTGIRKARGEFVCFMDPDDWYPESDILETLYSTAKRERVCICGGSLEEHKPDGTVVRDFNPNASNWGGKFSQDGIMRFRDYQYDWGYQRFVFSRKFLVVNDIFFPPYIRFQDPPFFVKAMVLAEKFYALRKITYAYRVAYKEPVFSNPRKLSDMFSGIADVVNLAQTYGLEKLTERLFNQNYQSKWALPQILETAEKSLEVATKIKRTFDLFPEELRWTANALWWNFDKRSPIVSVVVPVYNAEKYLRRCLDSLCRQTLRNIEIVCVNDGSTDSSLQILQEYADSDSRVKIFSQKNGGEGAAKNAGISHSTGKYVAILDPDDYVDSDFYEKLACAALKNGTIITKGESKIEKDGTVSKPAWDLNSWILGNAGKFPLFSRFYYQHCTAVYNREFLTKNEITFGSASVGADLEFLLKLGMRTESISIVPGAFHYYVQSSEGVSRIYNDSYFNANLAYINICVDLLNTRNKFDAGYYIYLKGRLTQLLDTVLPQLVQSGSDFSAIKSFLEEATGIVKKIHGIKNLTDLFPAGDSSNAFAFLSFGMEEMLARAAFLCGSKFTPGAPFVSVVVPVYNVEKYLRECLDSVCGQTLRNIEIICVNDGSTDGSLAILEEYASRDSRMRIISQENRGLSAARNAGLSVARGKYIYFMDSDDVSPQGALGRMFAEMEANSLDVLFFGAESFFESEELEKAHPVYKTLYKRRPFETQSGQSLALAFKNAGVGFSPSACCYCSSRGFLNENSIRFPEGILYEDNVFFWKMLLSATRAKSISDALFRRRVRAGSTMTNKKISFRNFEGYAIVVSELEKLAGTLSGTASPEILRDRCCYPIEAMQRFYHKISPEDRARSRELLSGALKDSAWLDSVRECIEKIDNWEALMNGESPAVSVILPVYNTEKYLRECLDSICGQTLRNIEIICVDDGSTDLSPKILEEYATKDSRIKILHQKNLYAGVARNAGMKIARGKYYSFLDSDDLYAPTLLEKMVSRAEETGADVVSCVFRRLSETGLGPLVDGFREGTEGVFCPLEFADSPGQFYYPAAWCHLFRAEHVKAIGGTFFGTRISNDIGFVVSTILSAKKVAYVNEHLVTHRIGHSECVTKTRAAHWRDNIASWKDLRERMRRLGLYDRFSAYLEWCLGGDFCYMLTLGAGQDFLDAVYEAFPGLSSKTKARLLGCFKRNAGRVDSREPAGEASEGSGDGNASSPEGKKIYPAFLVRLGAAFILNKAARKRWRERHMDLTPKDGIDVNAHPELRRDSALKRFAVRAASLFIFSKKKRKAFRAKHLNLRPRDGVDVRAIPKQELARLREAKRSRSTLWRVFDALVPATRGKITHTERHLRRAAEEQTRILIDELRRMHDENRRAFDESRRVVDENRRTLGAVRAELKTVRERADALSRELAASKTELKNQTLATERALRAELSATREALTLKTLAAKHAVLDAESNLQARLGEVLEALGTARNESAQTAAETVRAVNARADALPRMFEEALARNAESTKSALLAAKTELCTSVEAAEMRHAETSSRLARLEEQCKAVQSATAEIPGKLSALSALVPASEKRVLDAVMSRDVLYDSSYEIKTREERGLCDMVSAPDFEMRFRKLIAGLPEESVETVGVIIRRLQMIKGAKTKLDLWTPEEKEQLKRIRHFEKSILKIADDLFVWKNCFLPIKHFEASVFFYNHGISQLDSVAPIRGKDILDVGGFIGDSALMLHGLTEGKVYSFEATSENYNHMLKTIELNRLTNVVPVHAAVGESKGMIELRFQGSGSSQDPMMIKDPKYVEKCPVVAIDDFVAEHGIRVGLIKVDIEGAEQSFLRGAKKTICEQKPILLISIYHNVSDFLDIKPMIESWNLGYKFKIFKPVMGTVSSETLLICEQPNA